MSTVSHVVKEAISILEAGAALSSGTFTLGCRYLCGKGVGQFDENSKSFVATTGVSGEIGGKFTRVRINSRNAALAALAALANDILSMATLKGSHENLSIMRSAVVSYTQTL
jgi:hypothetical protein